LVLARRTAVVPLFESPPQQYDHVRAADWKGPKSPQPFALRNPWLARKFPGVARAMNMVRSAYGLWRSHSIRNRQSFKPVKRP
jgi:hypothetical protein